MTLPTLPVVLDRRADTALPVQLAAQVRALVRSRRLAPGSVVPSSRRLAGDLGVSRAVTEQAYAQLVAEGWLEGRHGAGTFVAGTVPAGPSAPPPAARRRPPASPLVSLDTGTPWIDARHRSGWRRAWREVSAAVPPLGYDDARGLPELRELVADRLRRTRGLTVGADDVMITSGTVDGLLHLMPELAPGPVAVEDPGYRAALEVVRAAGRAVLDLPARQRIPLPPAAVAAYVTPAHQHPLGHVMSAGERTALLAAAAAGQTLIIEDDYDSEFRYDVAPIPALASLDPDRVAYLGTASKAVAPSLRLGWLVPPRSMAAAIEARRRVTHQSAPWPVQRAFLSLLRDGYVDAVVRSARRVYTARAERVAAALGPLGELQSPVAGMYATVLMPATDATAAQRRARRAGFAVSLLSDYCRSAGLTGLVVGFGGCTDDQLDRALSALTS